MPQVQLADPSGEKNLLQQLHKAVGSHCVSADLHKVHVPIRYFVPNVVKTNGNVLGSDVEFRI